MEQISNFKRRARYEQRQEAILAAAARLFNQKGLRGATFADVANAVGLITTSVTYYYRKKDDLAAACMLRTIAAFEKLITAARGQTPRDRLIHFNESYFALLADIAQERHSDLATFYDIRSVTGDAMDRAFAAFNMMFRNLRAMLRETPGQRTLPRANENARTHLILSQILWARTWVENYEPKDYKRAGARMTDILIYGLRGPSASETWPPPNLNLPDVGLGKVSVMQAAYLRAATETINSRGYQGASVDAIAAQLDVTRGSFYHHHDNRDEVLLSCFNRSFSIIQATQDAARTIDAPAWDRLIAIADSLIRRQTGGSPLLRHIAMAAARVDLRPELKLRSQRQAAHYAALITDGMAERFVRQVDPAIAAQMIVETIDSAADLSRWTDDPLTPESASQLYLRPFLEGLFRNA